MRVIRSSFAERLVQQQQARIVHQCARQRGSLCHAAGKLVWIGVGEVGQADKTQRLIHARRLAGQQAARLQSQCRVGAHGAPRVQRRVLEHQDTRWMRTGDALAIHQQRASSGRFQSGHKAQQCGLAAAAGAEQGDELAWLGTDGHVVQHQQGFAVQVEVMADVETVERRAGDQRRAGTRCLSYHCTSPFCQESNRSRSRNSRVMSPVHISAITSNAEYMLA